MQSSAHTSSARPYVVTWIVLVALTGASFLGASVNLGVYAMLVALAIATVKAGLVAAVFMHLRATSGLPRFAMFVALAFVLLLCGLVFTDVAFRRTSPAAPLPRPRGAAPEPASELFRPQAERATAWS